MQENPSFSKIKRSFGSFVKLMGPKVIGTRQEQRQRHKRRDEITAQLVTRWRAKGDTMKYLTDPVTTVPKGICPAKVDESRA